MSLCTLPNGLPFDRVPSRSGAGIFDPLWCELPTGSQKGWASMTCPRRRLNALRSNAGQTCSRRIVDCCMCKCRHSFFLDGTHPWPLVRTGLLNKSTFSLHRCGRAQRPDVAVKVVFGMRKEGIRPSSTLSNTYFKAKKVGFVLDTCGIFKFKPVHVFLSPFVVHGSFY